MALSGSTTDYWRIVHLDTLERNIIYSELVIANYERSVQLLEGFSTINEPHKSRLLAQYERIIVQHRGIIQRSRQIRGTLLTSLF
jgi:hypothetical protein